MAAHISISKQLHYAQNGEMGGVDIREPSTAVFATSSIDRYSGPYVSQASSEFVDSQVNPVYPLGVAFPLTPYDFQINSRQNLLAGFFTRIAVSEVIFRWTIPTITTRNQLIYLVFAPGGLSSITSFSIAGGSITFNGASFTGYTTGQTVAIGNVPPYTDSTGTVWNVNGSYVLTGKTALTLVASAGSLPTTYPTSTASVGIQYLLTVPEGWYNLTNNAVSGANAGGNLAYTLQGLARTATSSSTFAVAYNNDPTNTTLSAIATAQPYNAFTSSSGTTDTYYWLRWTDPSAPNRVGLFEMMAWKTTQSFATSQNGSPNASMLSSPFVDIVCDNLTYNQGLKDADTGVSHNILCRIYIVPDAFTGNMANLGSAPILVHRAFPIAKQVRWRADQNIGNLKFQVYDSQGYLLTTGDGVSGTTSGSYYDSDMGDWTMTMLVTEV